MYKSQITEEQLTHSTIYKPILGLDDICTVDVYSFCYWQETSIRRHTIYVIGYISDEKKLVNTIQTENLWIYLI